MTFCHKTFQWAGLRQNREPINLCETPEQSVCLFSQFPDCSDPAITWKLFHLVCLMSISANEGSFLFSSPYLQYSLQNYISFHPAELWHIFLCFLVSYFFSCLMLYAIVIPLCNLAFSGLQLSFFVHLDLKTNKQSTTPPPPIPKTTSKQKESGEKSLSFKNKLQPLQEPSF